MPSHSFNDPVTTTLSATMKYRVEYLYLSYQRENSGMSGEKSPSTTAGDLNDDLVIAKRER